MSSQVYEEGAKNIGFNLLLLNFKNIFLQYVLEFLLSKFRGTRFEV